ncbi:hypothetical protein PCASD_21670 [Puccinia coronata f. sp. avenae]|uniref:Uncharacterized protein n=1 Tax=Puccinia coronata f. sp. avenae TaxID=200324 RepID=A0A2N5U359_9BASI|nr:hypothetical protein PCASD_21670 [Puccinia coronata f. sp. avenae]
MWPVLSCQAIWELPACQDKLASRELFEQQDLGKQRALDQQQALGKQRALGHVAVVLAW